MARGPKKGANPAQNIKPGYLLVRTTDTEPVKALESKSNRVGNQGSQPLPSLAFKLNAASA